MIKNNFKKYSEKEQTIFIAGAFWGIDELVKNMEGSAGSLASFLANHCVKYKIIKSLRKTKKL